MEIVVYETNSLFMWRNQNKWTVQLLHTSFCFVFPIRLRVFLWQIMKGKWDWLSNNNLCKVYSTLPLSHHIEAWLHFEGSTYNVHKPHSWWQKREKWSSLLLLNVLCFSQEVNFFGTSQKESLDHMLKERKKLFVNGFRNVILGRIKQFKMVVSVSLYLFNAR